MWLKYGYGRACAQISVDIRSGFVTREYGETALRHLEKNIFPSEYCDIGLAEILNRIDMTRDEFDEIVREFTRGEKHEQAAVVEAGD